MRQVELRLQFIFAMRPRCVSLGGPTVAVGMPFETAFDLLGFVDTDGARVSFLLCYANFWQDIENCFAFNFELPCQIVNSNFIHYAF